MKLADLKIDAGRSEAGAWVSNIPELGDVQFRVRGIGNADFRRRQVELGRGLSTLKRDDPDEADRIMTVLLLETVLIDWKGITDDTGAEVLYSRERAKELLTDPDFGKIRDGVFWAARMVAAGRAETTAADAKN